MSVWHSSGRKPVGLGASLWASLLTLMMRTSELSFAAVLVRMGNSSLVRSACPYWSHKRFIWRGVCVRMRPRGANSYHMIRAELDLISIRRQGRWLRHNTGIVHQHIQAIVLGTERLGRLLDRGKRG